MEEYWKPLPFGNYEYEISNLGIIRNSKTKRMIKPYTDSQQEYDRVCLYVNKIKRRFMVHTLVAQSFIGPKPAGCEVDHLNTNIHDNRACNLRYVTQEENRSNPITIFNRQVSKIRKAIASGKYTQDDILRLVKAIKDTL